MKLVNTSKYVSEYIQPSFVCQVMVPILFLIVHLRVGECRWPAQVQLVSVTRRNDILSPRRHNRSTLLYMGTILIL